jgi:uncharacterized protein
MSVFSHTKLSTEMNLFDHQDGTSLVHFPIRGYALRVKADSREILERLRNGEELSQAEGNSNLVAELKRIGAIGAHPRPRPNTAMVARFEPWEATLIFTETCNLGCSYCYASALPAKSAAMTVEIATAAVDLVISNAARRHNRLASIRYIGGGEPTVEWDLLRQATQYARAQASQNNVGLFIRLITNGTLLTDERIAWLAENIHFVTLSFDILPDLQGKNRPFADGRATHDKLLNVINRLGSQGVKFHLRATISSAGASRLVEMVDYVRQHTCAKSVRFEPMAEIGRSSNTELSKPHQEIFAESFKAAYLLGREHGIDVNL